jgi:SAM-dependent methyltransferase
LLNNNNQLKDNYNLNAKLIFLKALVKNILKNPGLYYFLQGSYRQLLLKKKKIFCSIKYAKWKGSGFTCNCCGESYSKFVPDYPSAENKNAIAVNHVIAGYGTNILCPACLSTARERLIMALFKNEFTLTGKYILHLSPEKILYEYLKINNTVITADIEPLLYKNIDAHIKQQDATRLSYSNDSFDVVIGNHIMEHIPEDTKAIAEIYRILKPGGRAILQVPYSTAIPDTIEAPDMQDPKKQAALFGQKDHVRIYQLQDYINRIQQAGFKVRVIGYDDLAAYYKNAIQEKESFLSILK